MFRCRYLCFALMTTTVVLAALAIHKDVAVCTAAVARHQAQSKLPPMVINQLKIISYLRRWVLSPALVRNPTEILFSLQTEPF